MGVSELETTDGFVIRDFDGCPAAGVVRRARKILHSSAGDLARSATYTFATHGMVRSGASAGINAEGEAIGPALEAAMAELEPTVEAGELHLHPGKGVTADELAPLRQASGLGPLAGSDRAVVAGVIAAARWAAGGSLDGKRVAIEEASGSPAPAGLAEAVTGAGAEVVDVAGVAEKPWLVWGADADLILAGSKPGTLTHQGVEFVKAAAVVPWGPIPVTTKALATLLKRDGAVVVPDFVSAGGALIAGYLDGDDDRVLADIADRVGAILDEVGGHDEGVFLGACYRAEDFIRTWQPAPPFGRPLAA